jgi:hypothetical protein
MLIKQAPDRAGIAVCDGTNRPALRFERAVGPIGCRMKPNMNLTEEFYKHATDCDEMARLTRDSESKAAWRELAERFRHVAQRTSPLPSYAAKRRGVPDARAGRAA